MVPSNITGFAFAHLHAAGPLDGAAVVSFVGTEGISTVPQFTLEVVAQLHHSLTQLMEECIGDNASFRPASAERSFSGIVTKVALHASTPEGQHLRVTLEPPLAALEHRLNSRVFTDLTAIDVVRTILDEHEVSHEWRIAREYSRRRQLIQYQETDLSLVERLLAEDGLFFWHDPDPTPTLVIADEADAYSNSSVILHASQNAQGSSLHHELGIHDFTVAERRVTAEVIQRTYNVKRPAIAMDVNASSARSMVEAQGLRHAQSYIPPHGAYVHGRDDIQDEELLSATGRVLAEQAAHGKTIATGSCDSVLLCPGTTFALEDHCVEELNRRWTMVHVQHETQPEDDAAPHYVATFEAVLSSTPHRPALRPRNAIQSIEAALVVGPEDGQVHTDELGRIRVRFHWERRSSEDPAYAWVRVAQPWAGAGFGAQFVPRVGMEVIVSFLGGDPNQPVVLGNLYNGASPPLSPLPEQHHWSGFGCRSAATPRKCRNLDLLAWWSLEKAGPPWQVAKCKTVTPRRPRGRRVRNEHRGSRPIHGRDGAVCGDDDAYAVRRGAWDDA